MGLYRCKDVKQRQRQGAVAGLSERMHACMHAWHGQARAAWTCGEAPEGSPPPAEGGAERKHKGLEEAEKAAGEWAESEGEGEGEEGEPSPKRAKAGDGSKEQQKAKKKKKEEGKKGKKAKLKAKAKGKHAQ